MHTDYLCKRFYQRLFYKTILAAIVSIALVVNHYIYPFIPTLKQTHGQIIWIILGIFNCFIVFLCGSYIYRTAWTTFKLNETNKNTLIALGTLILLVYSMLRVIFPSKIAPLFMENYFCSAVLITTLANFAMLLEIHAKRTNKFLLRHLNNLLPSNVTIVEEQNERQIPISELKPGDIIKINPGETFAADGLIIKGQTKVDPYKLNGDPIPENKTVGDEILAGSLNKTTCVYYKATYVGKNTALAHIIETVGAAQNSKTNANQFMRVFTTIFIPVILLFAVIIMLIWYNFGPTPHYVHAMLRAVTILVIASPTALALSIPIPVLMGIGKAAQYGILIRNAKTLMKVAKISCVVFDKSGIITEGKPQLMCLHTQSEHSETQLLQYAASLESRYEHPVANAVVQAAQDRNITLLESKNFTIKQGYGVSALIDNKYVALGNIKFMQQQNIELNTLTDTAQKMAQQGHTTLFVAVGKQAIGLLTLQDDFRKDTRDAIKRLTELGIEPIMFTADNRVSAESLGRQIGINNVFANISPRGKLKEIKRLQQQGEIVAMVAEAANDAPALAHVDIGIAVATHNHLTLETANVTLMRNSLHGISDVIHIACATRNKIKQNLFISIGYNAIALVLASGVLYPLSHWLLMPAEATVLMTACSLSVIINANRLLHFQPFKLRKRAKL